VNVAFTPEIQRKTSFPLVFRSVCTTFAPKEEKKDMRDKTFISFDWALKRLLRDKANFDVL
jgi:hypothetical protein